MSKELQGVDLDMDCNGTLNEGRVNIGSCAVLLAPDLNADQNNYNPDGFQEVSWLQINLPGSGPNVTLTGIQQPVEDGGALGPIPVNRKLMITNRSAGRRGLTLSNNDQLSSAENRFLHSGSHTIQPLETAQIVYDITVNKWRIINFH
jgi:hypothetical protein